MIEFTTGGILQENTEALVEPLMKCSESDPAIDRSGQYTVEAEAIGLRDSSSTK